MSKGHVSIYRGWEYEEKGDYHRNLDPNWSYTPTYLHKLDFVRKQIQKLGQAARILDAGCGEGVLVEEFRHQGFQIEGIDLNYESEIVQRGSVLDLPYRETSFDAVLLLDVFEHLSYADQVNALSEIRRVLRSEGHFIASIPNLAHWNSRLRFMLLGKLHRTDCEINHIGERPFAENKKLLMEAGFWIEKIKGITLTVPFVYPWIISRRPARFRWLHDLLEIIAVPSLTLIDVFVCRKKQSDRYESNCA